jgi:hypothetical protein
MRLDGWTAILGKQSYTAGEASGTVASAQTPNERVF